LNVVGVTLPPLRDHREDIPYLTAAFIRACSLRLQKPLTGLTPAAERVLSNARWEGNVRELKNAIERACILAEGTLISERELAGAFGLDLPAAARLNTPSGESRPGEPPAALEDIEREHIVDVLRQVKGNRMAAAKLLGISRRALYRRLDRHHIVDEAPRQFGGTRS
jgi:two-component system response regulator AtoC